METKYLDGKLGITIPGDWQMIESHKVAEIYSQEHKPFLAIKNGETLGSCMLFYTEELLDKTNFDEVFALHHTHFKRMTAGYAEFGTPEKEKDGTRYKCVIFKQNSPDGGELFTIFFLTYLEGKMLFGIFSCPYKNRELFNNQAIALIEGIVIY